MLKHTQTLFPLATASVNILGCLLAGVLLGLFARHSQSCPELRFLFITGFCGGYTTFSAFAVENVSLLQSGHVWIALLYTVSSVVIGVLAVWGGLLLTGSSPTAP
jgi:CrcB protein